MAKLQRYSESGVHVLAPPPRPRYARVRKLASFAGRVVLVLCVLLLMMTWLGWLWLSRTVTAFAGPHFNHGQNAVWLEHTWAGDPHSSAEFDQLARQLKQEQIGFVF